MGSKHPKLSREDLDLLIEKTYFTKAQIKQWHKGFMTITIIERFDLKRDNRNIKVAKDCPTLVTVLKEFRKDCPSGQLSRKKFLSIYTTLFPDGKAGAFYEHVFRTFDEDGSGRIDFKEFLQAISVTQSGRPHEKLELAFRLYDIDRNGLIDQREMADIMKAIYLMMDYDPTEIGETPDIRTKDIFEKMDTNQDGVLSKDEFIKGCLSDDKLYNMLASSCSNPTSPDSKIDDSY